MEQDRPYFFCGIGGSGMLPLATIMKARGFSVSGSDRALDQKRGGEKFDLLRNMGVELFLQDGAGVSSSDQIIVSSAAIEETVPDIQKAIALGAKRISRADLLSSLFNRSKLPIGVAGTSGKSTTTALIGWILDQAGLDPVIVNGAVMKNFQSAARIGMGAPFLCEVDESDGSIAHYAPKIAVINNIAFDHKPLSELYALFGDFCAKADCAILNLDNPGSGSLVGRARRSIAYSLENPAAELFADEIREEDQSVSFRLHHSGRKTPILLPLPGRYNVSNALAALGAALALGVAPEQACATLPRFAGIKRRMEMAGVAKGVAVIDDFAHNPDKIGAALSALHARPGRILLLFQPHGFGPLRLLRQDFIRCFERNLAPCDILALAPPAYFGGSADRSVTEIDIARSLTGGARRVLYGKSREELGKELAYEARNGDRIVVMGARDDSLSQLAAQILEEIKTRPA